MKRVTQRVSGITEEISQLRRLIEQKKLEETRSKTNLDVLRAEYATALGKKGSLEAVIAEHGYSTESVRRLFQSGVMQGGLAPVGVLADFLEVEPRYERVVEDFLRDELNYVVVKSWDAADEGLRMLRTGVDGRATFLVHPEDSQAKFSFVLDEAAHCAPPAAQIVPLKNTIRVLDGFGKSLEVILPKLRDGYIVPEADVARGLALENPDAFFLSQAGECFHNVTVTGGKQRSEGPLSMKRELREVLRQLEDLERALRDEEMRVLTLGREIKDLTSLLERLDGEKREAEHQAMTSGHMLQQLDSEMTRVSERLSVSQLELQRLAAERAEQEGIVCARQSEIETAGTAAHPTRTANRRRPGISRPLCASAAKNRRRPPLSTPPAWPRSKSATARPPRSCSASNRYSRKWASASTLWPRKSKPPPRKNCSANPKTSNSRSTPPTSKPNATPRKPAKACCNLKPNNSAPASPKSTNSCATAACCSIRPATAAANFPPPPPSCNPTRNTCPKPASTNSASNAPH